jgi:hypothetical protein
MIRVVRMTVWFLGTASAVLWLASWYGIGYATAARTVVILLDSGSVIVATPHAAGYLAEADDWQFGGALGDYRWMMEFFGDIGVWTETVNLVTIMAACATAVVVQLLLAWFVRRRRHFSGSCEDCGYALTGLTAPRCPECGRAFHHPLRGVTG